MMSLYVSIYVLQYRCCYCIYFCEIICLLICSCNNLCVSGCRLHLLCFRSVYYCAVFRFLLDDGALYLSDKVYAKEIDVKKSRISMVFRMNRHDVCLSICLGWACIVIIWCTVGRFKLMVG